MRPDERMNQLQRRVVNHALADRMLKVSRGEPISVMRDGPRMERPFTSLSQTYLAWIGTMRCRGFGGLDLPHRHSWP